MKIRMIIALLSGMVAASQPALTEVRTAPAENEPPHVASHETLEAVAPMATLQTGSGPVPGDMLLVALPFSSLQLSPSLAEHLTLTPSQGKAIQSLMDRERPTTEPLMRELETVSKQLSVVQHDQENQDKEAAHRLAVEQTRLLRQLMKVNSRLRQDINNVLDPSQRKKLNALERSNEVSVREGN